MSELLFATLTSGAVFLASVSLLPKLGGRRPPPPPEQRLPVGARARRRQNARA